MRGSDCTVQCPRSGATHESVAVSRSLTLVASFRHHGPPSAGREGFGGVGWGGVGRARYVCVAVKVKVPVLYSFSTLQN